MTCLLTRSFVKMFHFFAQRNPHIVTSLNIPMCLPPILVWAKSIPIHQVLPNLFEGASCDMPSSSSCPLREDVGVEVAVTVLRFLQLIVPLIDTTFQQWGLRDSLTDFATHCIGVWNSDVLQILPSLSMLLEDAWISKRDKFILDLQNVLKVESSLYFDMQAVCCVEALLPTASPSIHDGVFRIVFDYLVNLSKQRQILPVPSTSSSHT